jgi:3-oxoacyl-[acyl-carrier-protein] synthase II
MSKKESSMNRRVVITGAGVVSPLGTGIGPFFGRLLEGRSGIAEISTFDTAGFPSHLGAMLSDFNPKDIINVKSIRKMDALSRTAVAAVKLAADDATLVINEKNRDRTGIVLGTAFGATDISIMFVNTLFTEGPMMINPLHVPNTVMNAPSGHASIELGFRGVNSTINHKESSAETAIVYAASEIIRGTADVMFAGGAEIISPLLFEVMTRFRALSPIDGKSEGAHPFDKKRNGTVVGEGAGVICLELLDRARERGAVIYGEVRGWGMSSSPAPPTDYPADPKGYISATRKALAAAGLSAGDIDYVSAAANGGIKIDRLEAGALTAIFGSDKKSPLVSSIKGAVGESFSSGGIRAVALASSIKNGVVPQTLGLSDPIAPLNLVTERREVKITNALLSGVSSGGTFVSLVFSRFEE